MLPTLEDGDVVLVLHGGAVRAARLAVVRLPGGRPLGIKRLGDRDDDGWWVIADNPVGTDSRTFGRIGDDAVVARVLLRVRPLLRRRSR